MTITISRLYSTPGARITGLVRFEVPTVRSRKVQCTTCGATGYGPEGAWTPADIRPAAPPRFLTNCLTPWQRGCIAGHEACQGCGRIIRLTKKGNGRRAHSMGHFARVCTDVTP